MRNSKKLSSKKKPSITHVTLLIDASGSMGNESINVVRGFNAFLKEQQELFDPAKISVYSFGDVFRTYLEDQSVITAQPFKEFHCDGGTPLYRSIQRTIQLIERRMNSEDRAILIIMTDGGESHMNSWESLVKKVQDLQNSGKWTFIYLSMGGANCEPAQYLGIPQSNQINMTGTATTAMSAISTAVTTLRVAPDAAQTALQEAHKEARG